jgi:multiple antibiotic resistance protein
MPYIRPCVKKMRRHLCHRWHTRLVVALAVAVGCLIGASTASAAEAVAREVLMQQRPVAQIFTFLFLMLGPFKIIHPFLEITKGADAKFTRQIAIRATLFASLALLLAAIIGESSLSSYGIPLPVLALSAGIILFLVALLNILQQFTPSTSHSEDSEGPVPTLNLALMPLAFPSIVTPYGIATLVVFLALSPDLQTRLTIGAIVLAIMLLNLITMLIARRIPPIGGVLLAILGAVLGIIQVALGLQIIQNSLKALGVL